jgi:hypothetical protein
MLRALPGVLVALALGGIACSSDDPEVERRGGPLPDPGAGGDSSGPSGTGGESPIAYCDALVVIRAKCQRCHGDPVAHGAPVSFLSASDFQKPYFNSDRTWREIAVERVENDQMPFLTLNTPPQSLMPPVEPLTASEKTTLLAWLKQGAEPLGGEACSND